MGGFGKSTRIHSEPGCRTIRCFAAVIAAVLSGWTGLARSQEVQWQRVTDPNERAFTVEVPVGWHVEVGVVRRNGIDPRPVITMRSADRAISLFYGDHRIPVFTAPSELLASGGFQEGMLFVPAPGMRTLVAQYARRFRADAVNLLCLHTHLDGAVFTGSERRVHLGEAWACAPHALPATAQYIALGHIHRPQRVPAPSPAEYAGSPLQLDYGEAGESKSFVRIDATPGRPATPGTKASAGSSTARW